MEEGAQRLRQVVLIPAYQPDRRLVDLVRRLSPYFRRIVLVDDGSTVGREFFSEVREFVEIVLVHSKNRGKGAALKTGFAYLLRGAEAADVITADADGQHRPEDILRVADAMADCPDGLTLGVRLFNGHVPFRSRFGNFITRLLFFLMTGFHVRDTQTGLRGIPASLLARIAAIPGDRYDYEMAMLADSRHHRQRPLQIPIETIYTAGNETSHFKPVLDALSIYRSLFLFCLSSILGFIIDNAIFAFVIWLLADRDTPRRQDILVAFGIARFVSANCNFLYNRLVVFRDRARGVGFFRYWLLVIGLLVCGCGLTDALAEFFDVRGVAITVLKVSVETVLFVLSYFIQKRFVFCCADSSPSEFS